MVVWLLLATFFLIIELSSPGFFFFLSLCIGSFAAALADFLLFDLQMQMFLFLVVSCSALIVLTLLVQSINKKNPPYYSNIYALRGKKGLVVKEITPQLSGSVQVERQLWGAIAREKSLVIPEGAVVEVVDVHGVHLIVIPV